MYWSRKGLGIEIFARAICCHRIVILKADTQAHTAADPKPRPSPRSLLTCALVCAASGPSANSAAQT